MPEPSPSLVRFRAAVQGSLAHLESRRQEINDLNVFPVADGDTGDNMVADAPAPCLTELDRLAEASGDRSLDEIGREEIVDSVARAALLGARGNSGVILSQLIRGAAEELISRPGELVDPVLIGAAMARAADRAYASVREPAEGTILTVMREMAASRRHRDRAHGDAAAAARCRARASRTAAIAEVLERAVTAGEESVRRGPDLLPVLREAGVVDAGGYGVVVVFAGVRRRAARRRGARARPSRAPARVTHPEHESSTYRYCTNFAVTATGADALEDPPAYIARLEAIGDSVLVVGDHATLKVHVHTDEPRARDRRCSTAGGDVSRLDVADMHAQVADRDRRLARPRPAPTASAAARWRSSPVPGHAGAVRPVARLRRPRRRGDAEPLDLRLLAGIHTVAAEEVVVLPNSGNVIMAARARGRAVRQDGAPSSRRVRSRPGSRRPWRCSTDRSARRRTPPRWSRRSPACAPATSRPRRATTPRGASPSATPSASSTSELVAWGDPQQTLRDGARSPRRGGGAGHRASAATAPRSRGDAVTALAPAGVELELYEGGQPSRWWLLSAE